jgi:hypothetical protein
MQIQTKWIGPAAALLVSAGLLNFPLVLSSEGVAVTRGERIIAAQIHVLAGTNWQEVDAELERLSAAGYNTLIFRAFQNKRDRFHQLAADRAESGATGVYFATESAPVVADMVAPMAELCRRRGLRLFAWMTTRKMDWVKDKEEWLDRRFDLASGTVATGEPFDLFNPDFLKYLLRLYEDLARTPVDGIILQDDFVVKSYEGFSWAGLDRYHRHSGSRLTPETLFSEVFRGSDGALHPGRYSPDYQHWCRFKARYLLSLAEDIAAHCRGVRVNLTMALNVYYDTAVAPEIGIEWLGQDLEGIASSSYDIVCLMGYHRQMMSELEISVTEAIDLTTRLAAKLYEQLGDRLMMKLQAVDWVTGSRVDAAELQLLTGAFYVPVRHWALAPVEPDQIERIHLRKALRLDGDE